MLHSFWVLTRRTMKRPILIAVNVALATMGFTSPIRAELMVGASAVDITPILCNNVALDANAKQFDVRNDCFRWIHLAGFSPYIPFKKDNRLAEGIHDPLWSRALAIQGTNGETVVLVSMTCLGSHRSIAIGSGGESSVLTECQPLTSLSTRPILIRPQTRAAFGRR